MTPAGPEPSSSPTGPAAPGIRAAITRVLARIAPEADLAAVSPEANLRRELDLDSVDFQNFLIGLARELGRPIPDRDAGTLTSIAACERFFSHVRSEAGESASHS
jgi:acyl carrier protein